jgi:tetratricopeptide (TPR) repeat protein
LVVSYIRSGGNATERADAYIRRGQVKEQMASFDRAPEHERAIADFDEAIRLDPKKPLAYLGRAGARAYLIRIQIKADPRAQIKDKVNQQIADYSLAINLDPTLAGAYVARGVTYMQHSDNTDAAIADFSKAIELKPDWSGVYQDRGDMYVKQKKYKEALADYRTNLKLVKARTDEDNNNDIRIATQKILETEPLARSSTESSERPAPPAGGTAEKSEKQRPFAQLIADGYEINAVTLGLAEAGRWKNNHILVTLKKDKSVAVCSFPPPNWENMTDSTLADPKLCDVR